MRRFPALATVIAVHALATATAHAQSTTDLRLQVVGGERTPIVGALVAIADGDRIIAEALSTQRGTVTLSAPPGTYTIRVRRIGYKPYLSAPTTLPINNELTLAVQTERIILDAMVVSASAQCGAIRRDAQTLSTVWDEISKALRASQISLSDLSGMGTVLTYKRELGTDGHVVHSDTTTHPITTQRPFGVPDPPSLARLGYVRGTLQSGWEYFGPDETVLLSSEFAATHCFRVVRDAKKRPRQIGVAFEPAPKRQLSDIKGVLWVDEQTAELRDVNFNYVNADVLTKFDPGGFAKFLRVPSGAWIVSEWQLSMPKLELRMGPRDHISQIGTFENGGVIIGGAKPAGVEATAKK